MRAKGKKFNLKRLTVRLLSSTFYAGYAEIMAPNSEIRGPLVGPITGYLALLKTDDSEWLEVALAYSEKEGNGTCSKLMAKLLARKPEANFFAISKDPGFWAVAQKFGFVPITIDTLCEVDIPDLKVWAKQLGIGRRIPRSAKTVGKSKVVKGVRRLFIRRKR